MTLPSQVTKESGSDQYAPQKADKFSFGMKKLYMARLALLRKTEGSLLAYYRDCSSTPLAIFSTTAITSLSTGLFLKYSTSPGTSCNASAARFTPS